MQYSCYFKGTFEFLKEYDEIIVSLDGKKDYTNIPKFIRDHSPQRVVFEITQLDDLNLNDDFLNQIKEMPISFLFVSPYIEGVQEKIDILRKYNIPYFFHMLIGDWDVLNDVLSYHPSQMYIVNTLGFELPAVSKKLHAAGCMVRVFPNVCQSAVKTTSITDFFIRPEDIIYYEPYVDICEFLVDINDNLKKNAYFRVYGKNGKWPLELGHLIAGLEEDFSNDAINAFFGESRVSCGKRCIKDGSCRICQKSADLANLLTENELMLENDEPILSKEYKRDKKKKKKFEKNKKF